jgi:tetrahydromethanopterin S-methyltransferase subunit F
MRQITSFAVSTSRPVLSEPITVTEAVGSSSGAVPATSPRELETQLGGLLNERPELAVPLMACGLSLEVLVQAIGQEERRTVVKGAVESLKAKAGSRKETNDRILEEIKARLETLAKEKKLEPFLKAFKVIGMVLGAVAAVATIAIGVMTANPMLVAAGVLMGIMAVDSIVGAASDGKHSISAAVSKLAEKCGADEETAKKIAMAVQLLMMVASVFLSAGAASASSGAAAASKIMGILVKVQQVSAIANGVTAVGSGIGKVIQAVYGYETANSHART